MKAATHTPLALHPENPRYFRVKDGSSTGRPFSLTSYGTLMPCAFRGDEAAYLKAQGATYAVLWHPWSGCDPGAADWFDAAWSTPWRLACDPRDPAQRASCPEHPIWDLGSFDEAYWRQLEAVIAAAANKPGFSPEAKAHIAETISTLDEALKAGLVRQGV